METYQIIYVSILLFILGQSLGLLSKSKIQPLIINQKWINFPITIKNIIEESFGEELYYDNGYNYILVSRIKNNSYRVSFKLRESIINGNKVQNILSIINFINKDNINETKEFFYSIDEFSEQFNEDLDNTIKQL